MKTFEESTLSYICISGCGISIYNATNNYGFKCPECGGILIENPENRKEEKCE